MYDMDSTGLLDPGSPSDARRTRRADILALLRTAGRPLTVADVADRSGLHVNTARFHLDGLTSDGLAERATEPRTQPGRPRILYGARGAVAGPRSYRLLAEMLTGLAATLPQSDTTVLDVGHAWGRHLVERPSPSDRLDASAGIERLNRVLADIGFEPEVHPDPTNQIEIRLGHCPFREVAEKHKEVVCTMHLGLMRGALAELRVPVEAVSLQPFVTPTLCVAHLRATHPN